MERPGLKRTTQQIEAPNGDLYLLRPSAGTDIHIENPDEEGRQLLAALDGNRSREELVEEFGSEAVGDLLAQLEELGVVEDAADDDLIADHVFARFDRQFRYFADITTGPTGLPVPGQAGEGTDRRARRRRPRRLVGAQPGLPAGSARCCWSTSTGSR